MRFVVDGYNVAMSDPATASLPAEEQRAALVRRLAARGERMLGTGAITVVFDGRTDGAAEAVGTVEVRFSGDASADDIIVGMAGTGTAVVTSDAELRRRAEAAGARVLPASAAFDSARATKPARTGRCPAATAGLPKGANLITEELKGIWLVEDGSEE